MTVSIECAEYYSLKVREREERINMVGGKKEEGSLFLLLPSWKDAEGGNSERMKAITAIQTMDNILKMTLLSEENWQWGRKCSVHMHWAPINWSPPY